MVSTTTLPVTPPASNVSQWADWEGTIQANYRVVGICELIFAFVGPPLQVIVLYLASKMYRKWGQKSQLIVISMTSGDLIVSAIHSPLMFGFFGLDAAYPIAVCIIMYVPTYIGVIASSLSLLLLNIDKFIYLNKPLHYSNIVTGTKVSIAVIVCWLVAVFWSILIIFGPATEFKYDNECTLRPLDPGVYVCFVILFLTLPTLASFAVSLYIRYLVNRTRSADRQIEQEMNHLREKDADRRYSRRSQFGSHIVTGLRSIALVFSATIWNSCTVLPYRILIILVQFKIIPYTPPVWIIMFYCIILLSMNPVGNPIVIIMSQRMYRERIKRLLRFTRGYSDPNTTTPEHTTTQYTFT